MICQNCGAKNDTGARFCVECRTLLSPDGSAMPSPAASPRPWQAPPPAAPPPPAYEPPRKRGLAGCGWVLIVGGVILGIIVVIAIIAGIFSWGALVPFSVAYHPFSVILTVLWVLAGFFYFYYFEHKNGQTLGKKYLKIRVVREDYREISKKKAAIRSLLRMLYFINNWGALFVIIDIVLILVTDKKQRLGDLAAKTLVIKT